MIHWLVQRWDDLPPALQKEETAGLLSATEAEQFSRLTVPKRRSDWLLGRWTAKRLVQSYLWITRDQNISLDAIAIAVDSNGGPYVEWNGELGGEGNQGRVAVSLSISHSHGVAFCALTPLDADQVTQMLVSPSLGCDIELIEPRDPSFVQDFFTTAENVAVGNAGGQRDLFVTATWSAKESVLKALREGLRVDTRAVECEISLLQPWADEWRVFSIHLDSSREPRFAGNADWSGWWRLHSDDYVLTMVVREGAWT